MKFAFKTKFVLGHAAICAALLSTTLSTQAALQGEIKVKTIPQATVKQLKGVEIGTISGSKGFTCGVIPRLSLAAVTLPASGSPSSVQADPTWAVEEQNACGANPSTAIFTIDGVKNQEVTITFSAGDSNDVPATFVPTGIFQARAIGSLTSATANGGLSLNTLTSSLTTYETGGSGASGDAAEALADLEAVMAASLITINGGEKVSLGADGEAVLNVGGTLSITDTLQPGTPYELTYNVNVVY